MEYGSRRGKSRRFSFAFRIRRYGSAAQMAMGGPSFCKGGCLSLADLICCSRATIAVTLRFCRNCVPTDRRPRCGKHNPVWKPQRHSPRVAPMRKGQSPATAPVNAETSNACRLFIASLLSRCQSNQRFRERSSESSGCADDGAGLSFFEGCAPPLDLTGCSGLTATVPVRLLMKAGSYGLSLSWNCL